MRAVAGISYNKCAEDYENLTKSDSPATTIIEEHIRLMGSTQDRLNKLITRLTEVNYKATGPLISALDKESGSTGGVDSAANKLFKIHHDFERSLVLADELISSLEYFI
jgi:hypothetical protein